MSETAKGSPTKETSRDESVQVTAQLRSMVDGLSSGAVFVEGERLHLNTRAEQITGYSRNEIRTRGEWFSRLCQLKRTEAEEQYKSIRGAGFREPLMVNILRRDGAPRTLEIAAYRFDHHEIWFLNDATAQQEIENSLWETSNRLRAVLDAAVDAIVTIDHAGIITDVNPATEKLFGYSQEEMIGENVGILMPSPYREQHDSYLARYHETGETHIIGVGREVVAQKKDGSIFPVDLTVSEIDHLEIFVGVIRDTSERRDLERRILKVAEELQIATARELHDGLGSLLTAIKFAVEGLERRISKKSPDDAREVASIVKLVQDAVSQTRDISHGLHPVGSHPGDLYLSLRSLANSIPACSQRRIEFHGVKEIAVKDPLVANHLYRIAQEALNNALRHSGGSKITISLVEGESSIELSVTDNGTGLRRSSPEAGGIGLHTMMYRARAIGAHLDIRSRQSGGTEVICRLSMSESDHAENPSGCPVRH